MPGSAALGGWQDNLFYSLDVGSIHLTAMDTESPLDLAWVSSTQAEWLKHDLAKSKSLSQAWTIVYGHRPLYCSNHGGQDIPDGNKRLQAALEDILLEGQVDLVIQGHVHDYERSWPLRKGSPVARHYVDPSAPVYVVNGAAGNREDNDNPPAGQPWQPSVLDVDPGCKPFAQDVSFGILTISDTSLVWEQFVSASLRLIDRWNISKQRSASLEI
jgi:hypothetical protein